MVMTQAQQLRWSLIILLSAAATTVAAAQTVTESVKEAATDASITAQIETTFLFNRHLSPFNINTTTEDCVVTLTGSVADEIQRELAQGIAASVPGVESVTNNITVMGTILSPRPKRTWRQRIDDMTVSASIRSRLLYHKEFKGLNIGVGSELGTVTLFGVVGSEAQSKRIAKIADETHGVIEVKNELTVRAKEQRDQISNVGRQFSDEWIEKRVETAIVLNRHLSVRGLNVEVDDNICILTGTVDADEEKDLAESVASSIYGVETVRNEIRIYRTPN
jgi:osmotically-inducible protein OsmY